MFPLTTAEADRKVIKIKQTVIHWQLVGQKLEFLKKLSQQNKTFKAKTELFSRLNHSTPAPQIAAIM